MKYIAKKEEMEKVKKIYKNKYFVDTVGISESYISLIFNGKKQCPKVVAYTITKAIDKEAEIEDYFEAV